MQKDTSTGKFFKKIVNKDSVPYIYERRYITIPQKETEKQIAEQTFRHAPAGRS